MKISQAEMQAWLLTPILNELHKLEAKVSALSDQITAVAAQLTAAEAAAVQLATDLTAEIARLDAKIAAGSVTPADLTNLQGLATRLTALGTALGTMDTQATGA
jgi:hypothetical protein